MFVIIQYDKATLYIMTFTHQCFLLTVDITVFFNETTYDASDVDVPEVPLVFLSNPSSVNITIYVIITDLLLGTDIECHSYVNSLIMTKCDHRKLKWCWY